MVDKKRKRKVVDSTSVEVKKFVIDLIKMMRDNERYFFAKVMEAFRDLNGKHQRGLLSYFSEKCDQKRWKEAIEDTTMYNDVIRSILFYHSGREEIGQPCKKQLAHSLREYLESAQFRDAEEENEEDIVSSLSDI